MKITTNTNVRIVIIFSEPLSFVLTKMFIPPPVIAPEAPSDLPPWSNDKTMIIKPMIRNVMCNPVIISPLAALISYHNALYKANIYSSDALSSKIISLISAALSNS